MKAKEAKKDENEDEDEAKKEKGGLRLPAEQLQAFAGDYWSEELGVTYRLGVRDGALRVLAIVDRAGFPRANNFAKNEVQAAGKDKFSVGTAMVTFAFARDAASKVDGFVMDAERTTGLKFVQEKHGAQ